MVDPEQGVTIDASTMLILCGGLSSGVLGLARMSRLNISLKFLSGAPLSDLGIELPGKTHYWLKHPTIAMPRPMWRRLVAVPPELEFD